MKHLQVTNDALRGKLYHVPIDRDFEEMLIGAERYACGRRTYIVGDTIAYITPLLPYLSIHCLTVMQNDMKEVFDMAERSGSRELLGDACDYSEWVKFRDSVNAEIKRRAENES